MAFNASFHAGFTPAQFQPQYAASYGYQSGGGFGANYNMNSSMGMDPFMFGSDPSQQMFQSSWPGGGAVSASSAPPAQGFGFDMNTMLALILLAAQEKEGKNTTTTPTPPTGTNPQPQPQPVNKLQALNRIVANFDKYKAAGNTLDGTFGMEDVIAIRQNPKSYTAADRQFANMVYAKRTTIVPLADWCSPALGPIAHDGSSTKAQYQSAIALIQDKANVTKALNHVINNMGVIRQPGSNPNVLEVKDLRAKINQWATSGTVAEQQIAATFNRSYGGTNLVKILMNASNQNSATNAFIMPGAFNAVKNHIA